LVALLALSLAPSVTSCAGEAPCRYNSDCTDAYCSNGTCKQDCIDAALDCPRGYICNAVAQCEPPLPDAGVDAPRTTDAGADAAKTPDSSSHPDVTHSPDASHPPDVTSTPDAPHDDVTTHHDGGGGDANAPLETTLDLCTGDSACASGLVCRALYVGGAMRCTPSCASTAECWTGGRCVAVGTESYCVLSDVGATCTASTSCNFGCLTSQEYCTMPCASGSDCPNGYGCEGVGTPAVSVCVKAEAPCSATDTSACIAAAACDTSATLAVAGCTLACSDATDCPQRAAGFQPWTCDGLCRRPPDVFGPLQQGWNPAQYACNADDAVVNVCNDAQHIDFVAFDVPATPTVSCTAPTTTSGIATDSCVDSCLYQGTCAFGYACTALGSVGSARIGLCLPALGGGEVGASCTTDGDCFFGYCNRTMGLCSRDCTDDGICPTGSTCVDGGSIEVEGLPFRSCQ
jgi:hypothetical protein